MRAVLLISHGSRSARTKQEVVSLVRKIQRQRKNSIVQYAFLELEKPSIPKGIDLCVKKGVREIVILLNFLNAGKHVDVDIPRIIQSAQKKYPHISFRITRPVGQHPKIVDLFLDII